jgi:hypothetical protein
MGGEIQVCTFQGPCEAKITLYEVGSEDGYIAEYVCRGQSDSVNVYDCKSGARMSLVSPHILNDDYE